MQSPTRYPHKVTVQISRAENLLILSDKKGKKQSKWRILIMSHRKKIMTEYASCPLGNPMWSCEISLKLVKAQTEPIVLVVVDFCNNQVGQVVVPIIRIKPGGSLIGERDPIQTWQSSELEATRKCAQPTGHLFYRIWVEEYHPPESVQSQFNSGKRLSLFGWKQDPKSTQVTGGSNLNISHSEKSKAPKRLSFFKQNDKTEHSKFKIGKAKSLANINYIDTIEQSESSDSDLDRKNCFPPDRIYDDVTEDLGWVRVGDIAGDRPPHLQRNSVNSNGEEFVAVEVWSVQPDNGPITGNFTVVMEGSNFTSGLFDLTYICIEGIEPIDATTCTEIVSDTELILTMPQFPRPAMVTINLELLDGSLITCSKTFHYIDPTIEGNQAHVLTPRNGDDMYPVMTFLDDVVDQYEDVLSSPIHDYKHKSTNNTSGNTKSTLKRDSGMGSLNDKVDEPTNRRKLSDYGSQGSIFSERTASIRRKNHRQITMSKMELFEEVGVLRREVENLQVQLKELASSTNSQITALKCQLESRDTEIDNISHSLCSLKVKLLEDGLTDYLELK